MRTSSRRPLAAAALLAVLFGTACTTEQQRNAPPPVPSAASSAPASSAPSAPASSTKPPKPPPQRSERPDNPADPPLAKPGQQRDQRAGQVVKRVNTAADCRGLLTAREISRATGMRAAAAPGGGAGDCSFNLRGGGDGFSQVVLAEQRGGIGGRIRSTTVAGNPALEQDESDGRARSCTYRVRLNNDPQLNSLSVNVLFFNSGKNACGPARDLAGSAFARLPNR